jgi:formylglycine-generating enzyme required for sulfatase activity
VYNRAGGKPSGRPATAALGLLAAALIIPAALIRLPHRDEGHEITNAAGMKLVRIPAGEFLMGGQEPAEQLARDFAAYRRPAQYFHDEYPRHRVRITRPFYLGKYEVTVGQFRQFVHETGFRTESEVDGTGGWGYNPTTGKCEGRRPCYSWRSTGFPQTDDHPVVNVSWHDAAAFCRWLSRKEGKIYRLPTEAEWEYGCRAGTATRYANGNDPERLSEVARVTGDRGRTKFPHVQQMVISPGEPGHFTAPVGSYRPNAWGLYDMHGNVWEWCADWYGEDYYAHSPPDDPCCRDPGEHLRIRRGGAWNTYPLWARCSFRNWHAPGTRCLNLGFRVVREVAR